jgi:hypothetical protein
MLVTFSAGCPISEAAKQLVAAAKEHGEASGKFNDIALWAGKDSTPEQVVADFGKRMAAASKAYQESPGQPPHQSVVLLLGRCTALLALLCGLLALGPQHEGRCGGAGVALRDAGPKRPQRRHRSARDNRSGVREGGLRRRRELRP